MQKIVLPIISNSKKNIILAFNLICVKTLFNAKNLNKNLLFYIN